MDYQALGQKLIEKNFQSTQPIWKLKKSYEHYKGMLDDAKELVNKDTRAAKIFKEALKSALKWASGLVGERRRHPTAARRCPSARRVR